MTVTAGALWRTWTSYRGAPTVTRAFVAARLAIAPLGAVERALRDVSGRVVSLGSGISVIERVVAEVRPDLEFVGIDLDPRRVAMIERTASRSPRVSLRLGDATELDDVDAYDAVLACDALHHFPPDTHKPVAVSIARALKPGGVCIVKDLDIAPTWKYQWNRLHDRIVAGPDPIHCRAPGDMADILGSAGLQVEQAERIDGRWEPYAHYVVRARRPASEQTDGS
jgi:SAM-dependent methyltransferase